MQQIVIVYPLGELINSFVSFGAGMVLTAFALSIVRR